MSKLLALRTKYSTIRLKDLYNRFTIGPVKLHRINYHILSHTGRVIDGLLYDTTDETMPGIMIELDREIPIIRKNLSLYDIDKEAGFWDYNDEHIRYKFRWDRDHPDEWNGNCLLLDYNK